MQESQSKVIKMSGVLTADALFGSQESELEMLEVPELGGVVYLHPLTARDMMSFNETRVDGESDAELQKAQNVFMGRAIVDADGRRIVPEGEEDRLSDMPAKAYLRIIRAITAGMRDPAEDESVVVNATAEGEEGKESS